MRRTECNRDFRLGIQSQSLAVFRSEATHHLANPLMPVYFERGEHNRMRNASSECRRGAGGEVEDSLERTRASIVIRHLWSWPGRAARIKFIVALTLPPVRQLRRGIRRRNILLQFHWSLDTKYLTYSAHDQLRQAHIICRLDSIISVNNDSINSPFKSRVENVLLLDNNER